jgi:hypothetical protein
MKGLGDVRRQKKRKKRGSVDERNKEGRKCELMDGSGWGGGQIAR